MSGFEDQGLLHAGSPEEPGSPANSPQRPRVKKGIVKDNEMLPGDDSPQRPSKYKPEDYAQAVQEKIEEAVDLQAKYRHAGLYTLFVIAYLLVLYLQASAYKSGEVVRTLKQVMMPKDEDGNLLASTTFKDQHAVLGHLWHNILEPTWKVCFIVCVRVCVCARACVRACVCVSACGGVTVFEMYGGYIGIWRVRHALKRLSFLPTTFTLTLCHRLNNSEGSKIICYIIYSSKHPFTCVHNIMCCIASFQ